MNEQSKQTEFRVGVFVIIGLLLLAFSILLLGGENLLFTRYYYLNTKLEEVQGLREGSIVSLSGIKVGNIVDIRFEPEDNNLYLKLAINEDYKDRIRQGSTAGIRTQGALGDKFIYINPAPLSQPALEENGYLVKDTGGDLLGTLTDRGSELEKVFEILGEIEILLKRVNGDERSEKLMANLVESSQNLKEMLIQSKATVLDIRKNLPQDQKLAEAVASLSSILKKVDNGEGSLGALVNDPTVHSRLKAILGGSPRNRHLKSLIRTTIKESE